MTRNLQHWTRHWTSSSIKTCDLSIVRSLVIWLVVADNVNIPEVIPLTLYISKYFIKCVPLFLFFWRRVKIMKLNCLELLRFWFEKSVWHILWYFFLKSGWNLDNTAFIICLWVANETLTWPAFLSFTVSVLEVFEVF